jgi:hypothetical protein
MTLVPSRIVWCNGSIEEFTDTLNNLRRNSSELRSPEFPRTLSASREEYFASSDKYISAYISLGGKYNEPIVTFTNPSYLATHDFPTNTQYQMFPMFVRFPPKVGRCLVIIVDNFDNSEIREMNLKLIECATCQFSHIDVVLYDTKLHLQNIRPFAKTVVEWLTTNRISCENCTIANYIRFRGCSSIDNAQLEVILPQTIQNVLNESKTYVGCLYQWFGYQYYTYNLLYSYKKYNMSRHLKVILLLHECAESTQVLSENVSNLFMFELAREKTNRSVLLEFLSQTIDITSCSKSSDAMHSKMVDFCNYEMITT